MRELVFCDFISKDGLYCGLVAVYKDRCKRHLGEEIKVRKKFRRFRGDSVWQLEQGMGTNKEGSNV